MILIASRELLKLIPEMEVILEWFRATGRVLTVATDRLLNNIAQPGEPRRFALKRAGKTKFRALAVQSILAWFDRPALPEPSAGPLNTAVLWRNTLARHTLLMQSLQDPAVGAYRWLLANREGVPYYHLHN